MTAQIEKLVTDVAQELKTRSLKIATAESCTGGGLGYWLTSMPGSSDWYERGYITYSDTAKCEDLLVNSFTIDSFGAVSEHTAREMAEGLLDRASVDLSIAITGIAGPAGGTTEKPVGTVWIAVAQRDFASEVIKYFFTGTRSDIRHQAIVKALEKTIEVVKMKAEKIPTI